MARLSPIIIAGRNWPVGLGLGCFVLLAGCGGSPHCPVAGKVTVSSAPLVEGYVLFHPDAGQKISGAELPRAELGPGGRYELKSGDLLGALPGTYRVVIISQDFASRANSSASSVHPEPRPRIDRKYFAVATTPLQVTVGKDIKQPAYDFEVEPFSEK